MRTEKEIREVLKKLVDQKDWLLETGSTHQGIREVTACLKWVLNELDDEVH